MDRVFIEEETDGQYRIALIDPQRVFMASNPGLLATVFECCLTYPTLEDRSQIFYALAPSIGADNFFIDLYISHRSPKLNHWSIQHTNSSVMPLSDEDRFQLYSQRHSITATETITATGKSLFSLIELSGQQFWKNGILQRCIDCLVKPEYRKQAAVYSVLDKEYRRIMRFKLEISSIDLPIVVAIRDITSKLGLQHTHDETTIFTISESETFPKIPFLSIDGSVVENLSQILFRWSGSRIISNNDNSYRIEVDPIVKQGTEYVECILPKPASLVIIDTPM